MAALVEEISPGPEHRDPALGSFMEILVRHIASGRNVRDLPSSVIVALCNALKTSRSH